MNCLDCGNVILESEKFLDAGDGATRHEHCGMPEGYPVSAPDVQRLNDFIKAHERVQRCYRCGSLVEKLFDIVKHYESTALNALEAQKRFRDDEIVYLRALSMVLEMVGNAGTHKEKAVRLRGCVEMIETGISKLREETFSIASTWNFMPDLFRSDFPVRQYMDRIRELEHELEKATGKRQERTLIQAVMETDAPF